MTVTRSPAEVTPLATDDRDGSEPTHPGEPPAAFAIHRRSPDPFYALRAVRDGGGRVVDFTTVWANDAGIDLGEVPRPEIVGRRLSANFRDPANGREVLDALVEVVEADRSLIRVVRYELHGQAHCARLSLTPAGGDTVAATVIDVTAEHVAQARLEESEQRFRLLVESWAQAVWETEADGTVTVDSPSWRAYTGQTFDEWLGDGWADAVHPDDRHLALAQWRDAVREGLPLNGVFRIRRRSGWRWTNVRAAPLLAEDGSIRKWVGMNIDVTAAREARHELQRSEERLRLAMDVAGFATFDRDLRTGRVHWSSTLARIVGEPDHQPVGGLDAYTHPDDVPAVAHAEAETLESERPYRYEHRIVTADGSTRWVAIHGQTLFERADGGRRPVRSIGVAVDLTEQRRSGELRDVFVGMLSHELRTPVTAIYGGAQMLLRRQLPEPTREDILGDIVTEADRMRRLVENLLVLAKVERRAEVGLPIPVPLHPIVERAVADERRRSSEALIEVEAERGLPAVIGDEAALELAVGNLVSNALKYGPPGGRVVVRIGREDEHVTVRVLDEGPGLPDEGERVFELFYRAESARRSASGAGIGLYVARALIEGLGGRIWAANRPAGGAEFGLALPVVPEPEDGAR